MLGLGVMLCAGAVAQAAPAGTVVYLDKTAKFKIEHPKSWLITRQGVADDGKTRIVFLRNVDRTLRVRVMASPAPENVDFKAVLADLAKKARAIGIVDIQERAVLPEEKLPSRRTLRAFYLAAMARGMKIEDYYAMVTLVAAGGYVFRVVGTVLESNRPTHEQQLIDVIASFDVLGLPVFEGAAKASGPEAKSPPPRFPGKTKEVRDPRGGWKIVVPTDFLVEEMGVNKDQTHFYARILSPDANVRLFIDSLPPARPYDFAAHWKKFETILGTKYLEAVSELRSIAFEEKGPERTVSVRGYVGFAKRKTSLQAYQVLSGVAVYPDPRTRVLAVTAAVQRDRLTQYGDLVYAILLSAGPLAQPSAAGGKK
jgi:hypothetical protein